ncbi:hypothetical protein Tco_0979558 [Tanacetum coccineum]
MKEQMFVKGTNEEKEDEILNQDVSVGNVLKVIEADSISEKSREDESNGFKFKKETSFDFKIFETPKVDDKEKSVVRETDCSQKEKQSFDRIQIVSFRPESEIDVLKEDIKPDIIDASIRLQPKREASVAWYLKSPFKVRGSVLHTSVNNLTQTEVLTDTLFIMDEESDPVECVYYSCTTNVKIPRIFLESLAPGLKIEQPISVFDKYISKNSRGRCASILRNVEPERFKMKWRTCENKLESGVFLMSHMDNYFGEAESKWDYGVLKYSKESKYAARILMSKNNSYKDEFQKEVDKVRSIDKNKRRELIEVVVMRRPAKVDEYFGY